VRAGFRALLTELRNLIFTGNLYERTRGTRLRSSLENCFDKTLAKIIELEKHVVCFIFITGVRVASCYARRFAMQYSNGY